MFRKAVQDPHRAAGAVCAGLGAACPHGHYRWGLGRLRLVPQGPGPGRVLRKQPGLFGAESRGAREREAAVIESDLHAAVRQPANAGSLPVKLQFRQVIFQISQVAIRTKRSPPGAVAQRMEMLVARKRPRLVVEALQEPMEELPHPSRLARARLGGSAK